MHVHKIQPNPKKQLTIKNSLASFVSEDPELKYIAQKTFISYMRSLYFMQDKTIFKISNYNHVGYAESLGILNPPEISFKTRNKKSKNTSSELLDA